MDVSGAVVVVTGASSGIGWSTAWAFAREGSSVVLAARREHRLAKLAEEINTRGGRALPMVCDVTDPLMVTALFERVLAEFGRCDVLVNNAGIPQGRPFEDLDIEQIERVVGTNYLGVLYCTKAVLPTMLEAGRGHIVNVASIAGRFATPGAGVYSSTKHAVVAFSEALHFEVESRGLRVTAVNPGLVQTEGFPHDDPRERMLGVLQPEAVARLIVRVVKTGKAPEVSIPRWIAATQAVRVLSPPLYRFGLRAATRRPRKLR